jgi:hypothetical protein
MVPDVPSLEILTTMRPATELAIIRARAQHRELTDDQRRALADSTARLIARALGRPEHAGEWGAGSAGKPAVVVLTVCVDDCGAVTLREGEGAGGRQRGAARGTG